MSLRKDETEDFTLKHHQANKPRKMQSKATVCGFFFNICILCRLTNKQQSFMDK